MDLERGAEAAAAPASPSQWPRAWVQPGGFSLQQGTCEGTSSGRRTHQRERGCPEQGRPECGARGGSPGGVRGGGPCAILTEGKHHGSERPTTTLAGERTRVSTAPHLRELPPDPAPHPRSWGPGGPSVSSLFRPPASKRCPGPDEQGRPRRPRRPHTDAGCGREGQSRRLRGLGVNRELWSLAGGAGFLSPATQNRWQEWGRRASGKWKEAGSRRQQSGEVKVTFGGSF